MNQKEKSRQTEDYIINCGIEEFAKNGRLVSLNDICNNHNISKGKLYHHFSSKDELLGACVCYCLDKLSRNIDNFQIDEGLSVSDLFSNYYFSIIEHWRENPSHLTVLRLAYALRNKVFSDKSLEEIGKYKSKWRNSKKIKILKILHSANKALTTDDESIVQMLLLMYENTFQMFEDQLINAITAGNSEEADKFEKELINYHDTIINTILYGVFKD